MSAIYLTGTDGIKRTYSFNEILVFHDHEAEVKQRIRAIREHIDDMNDYQGDIKQVIEVLPGFWDRAYAEPVIEKLEDILAQIDDSKLHYELLAKNLEFMVECARKASSVEVQYRGKYDFRRDRYVDKTMQMFGKWHLHLHFSI